MGNFSLGLAASEFLISRKYRYIDVGLALATGDIVMKRCPALYGWRERDRWVAGGQGRHSDTMHTFTRQQ